MSDQDRLLLQIPHHQVTVSSEPQVYPCPIKNAQRGSTCRRMAFSSPGSMPRRASHRVGKRTSPITQQRSRCAPGCNSKVTTS